MEDLGRYASSVGWEPKDPWKKQRAKALEKLDHEMRDRGTMLRARPANAWTRKPKRTPQPPPRELFGTLWREGEVALLFGERGTGKSILAVQLADSIARGTRTLLSTSSLPDDRNSSLTTRHSSLAPKVLYIDLQRTAAQWAERYSASSWMPGRTVRHRFPPNLIRAEICLDLADRTEYLKDRRRYVQASIAREIESIKPAVVIVDDITLGGAGVETAAGFARTMQSLKHWAAEYSISVLAVVPSRPRRRPTALSLNDIATGRNIASLADTVFALSPSTFAPDIRYLKHLASPRPITHTAENVLTFQLGRTPGTQAPPPALRSATEPTEITEPSSSTLIPHSALHTPQSEGPFLGLTFIGTSAEEQHLRDYAAESLAADRSHERELKRLRQRTSKDILVDGILDGSYGKYLLGE